MRDTKILNVYRALDRGTVWLLGQMETDADPKSRLWRTVVYRGMGSVTGVFEAVGRLPELDEDAAAYWETVAETGAKWHHAYRKGYTSPEKGLAFCERNVGLVRATVENLAGTTDLAGAHAAVTIFNGVGDFIGYQVVLDLVEARDLTLDRNRWCLVGPGAVDVLRGIGRRGDNVAWTLLSLVDEHEDALGPDFPYWRDRRLTLADLEHAACEYRKYLRAAAGGGVRRFRPTEWRDDWLERID